MGEKHSSSSNWLLSIMNLQDDLVGWTADPRFPALSRLKPLFRCRRMPLPGQNFELIIGKHAKGWNLPASFRAFRVQLGFRDSKALKPKPKALHRTPSGAGGGGGTSAFRALTQTFAAGIVGLGFRV